MLRSIKSIVSLSVLSSLALAATLVTPKAAFAKPLGTDASYIGAGISAGLTNGGQDGDAATFGGNIQGRYAIPTTPISVRGAVLFSDDTSAIMPIVSYDLPITNSANAYLGVGYSFVENDGEPTPLGNKDAVVLTLGGEMELGKRVVLYGDTKLGIDAYEDSSASAVSVQTGLAYHF